VIEYTTDVEGVERRHLEGFFVGWPLPPSPERHLEILRGSAEVVLAKEGERVVGFVTAISDGVLSAYVPLLEVLPEYQGRGVGSELLRRLLERLDGRYMVDLSCDDDVVPFYERLGRFQRLDAAFGIRNRDAL
jgi:ribosomal protein S18 acetylase RimI-like enzyme